MPECYIRGSTIKYLRIPDEVIDMVKEDVQAKQRNRQDMQKGNRNQNQRNNPGQGNKPQGNRNAFGGNRPGGGGSGGGGPNRPGLGQQNRNKK